MVAFGDKIAFSLGHNILFVEREKRAACFGNARSSKTMSLIT
jgi:hypothetical protein